MQRVSSGYTRHLASRFLKSIRHWRITAKLNAGFTIIEALLFLGITGFLLAISFTYLKGNVNQNRFSQSMRDTQSKIQDVINDIPTGYTSATRDLNHYDCEEKHGPGGDHPHFKAPGGGPSGNTGECIFLGKAIQFTDYTLPASSGHLDNQESIIIIYPVFGLRTFQPPPPEDERPVANLTEAGPRAAVGINPYSGDKDLMEKFTIPGGARVKKILKSSTVAGDGVGGDGSHMAGFYMSLHQLLANQSGSTTVKGYQYNLAGNRDPGNVGDLHNDVDVCIAMQTDAVNCSKPLAISEDNWPEPLLDWQICFDNESNSDQAILSIRSVNGQSITTKLEFKEC